MVEKNSKPRKVSIGDTYKTRRGETWMVTSLYQGPAAERFARGETVPADDNEIDFGVGRIDPKNFSAIGIMGMMWGSKSLWELAEEGARFTGKRVTRGQFQSYIDSLGPLKDL